MIRDNDFERHFVRLSDWSDEALLGLLEHAGRLKSEDFRKPVAKSKTVGLLFFNPSLRTRVSFEMAAAHLGASTTLIQPGQGTWTFETRKGVIMDQDRTEHLTEAIQVISRYVDVLGVRAFSGMENETEDLEDHFMKEVVSYSSVPVINMESAREHPCQALADGLTLLERFRHRPAGKKFVLSWAPHPRPLPMAVPLSAMEIAARLGMDVTLACPKEMVPSERALTPIEQHAERNGSRLSITHSQEAAFQDADVIYGKSWAGPLVYEDPELEQELRSKSYAGWTINGQKMSLTSNACFMHCLPVRRNVVVADEVLDGPQAVHLGQAENRLHVQKALLMKIFKLL